MEIIIQDTPQEAAVAGARMVARLVREKPEAVLGLATGGTPLPLYRELVRMHREEDLDFSRVTTFNLDEYLSLGPEHPQSYHHFMREHLFEHINIPKENTHIPDGMTLDVPAFCRDYERRIAEAGGLDLQILGIGSDGHIGFNEPGSSFASRTRIKTLTRETLQDTARFFDGDSALVPRHCITMGIGTIMDARCVLLLAFGPGKADAVAGMVEGPVTASLPASILQHHSAAKILLDSPAAATLQRADYYRWVRENRPAWQQD
jgi:glucosamine-6-phosphate deaminase